MWDRLHNDGMAQTITQQVLTDARNWLLDCGAPPDLVKQASDRGIMAEVTRQYVGGWNAFMEDGCYEDPPITPLVVLG